jgi:hypothetical protein
MNAETPSGSIREIDELRPRCDFRPANEADAAIYDPMQEEFLSAYQAINHRVRELRAIRAGPSSADQEHAAQQAVERALLARDAVEDKYTRLGIIATPIVRDGFIREIQLRTPRPQEAEPSIISMTFSVMPPSCLEARQIENTAGPA